MYPSKEDVLIADRMQICRWNRFLPVASNSYELEIIKLVYDRFIYMGGMTPEISKHIGWDV